MLSQEVNISQDIQGIIDKSIRGVCIEIGSNSDSRNENHTFDFEDSAWIAVCIQRDPEIFSNLRKHRRLCLNYNCCSSREDNYRSLDSILEKTNLHKVDFVLTKNNASPIDVMNGFTPSRWGTNLIVLNTPMRVRDRLIDKMSLHGFESIKRVWNSEFFVKVGEPKEINRPLEDIFST